MQAGEPLLTNLRIKLPKLYPITDARLTGLSHAEQVRRLSAGGATFVQLREKHLSPKEFYREAEEALRVARSLSVRLIINDRVDLALALSADGVHLGQDDLPPAAARSLLGDEALIGFSTHSIEQASVAASLPVDYIAIGPIYETTSKENPDPVVGLDGLRRVRQVVGNIPLVAIGGIRPENIPYVLKAGADSVACISLLLAQPTEIESRTREILAEIEAEL
ncbi:MAG TPA: thiamine phosphate synthase [Pyrinomonadaceae bacterium]|nr:thiamine phosphate synthase [Pyrinomonadaceae bacterium]